ncbi:S41 family peptidase [candidate division KSB1 bacterium]|nr:S41 family peptidase [candidate division KSB1 bacterium]NIR71031.1 S41 family peptidase [candidate division KSB1 bacterium]NIS26116.1 S41 family peptidase [candidate division KSB1 bacterium]NIT72910.1 S41 family peptidase [candidate division KSB1 bacterium]NIU26755.1 S41 family peptidase [candidate division KSB1 bacterium]
MNRFTKSLIAMSIGGVLLVVSLQFNLFATGKNIYQQIERFLEVIKIVDRFYVEEVDPEALVDGAISGTLEQLDPHTVYISKDRLKEINEQFQGEFEGIGIEFVVNNKFPTIVSPISGSPSEEVGLRPGDKIIKIEGASTYGITEQGVREKLLGRKGTTVTIQIMRPGFEEPFDVTITRDKIPIYSLTAAFMMDEKTGFIKVGRFAQTTKDEFEEALQNLDAQGMRQLILDLRGNSGGYLEQAVEMADKLLQEGKRIVYTRGRIPSSNEDYYSTADVTHPGIPLIVLIDHGSASASEIVAGAMQDWDRGLIVGVTSFGKGLVQNQVALKDGSALRVTIARYYTPSGRLIQRAYDNGIHEYISEGWDDVDPNAMADSTANKPVFTTSTGRKVYGGGGISPDVFVKSKSLAKSTIKLMQRQVFLEFGSKYATKHRDLKRDFATFRNGFEVDAQMVQDVLSLAKSKGVEVEQEHIERDESFIKRRIKSQIARHLWGSVEYHQIEILGDEQVQSALKLFSEAAKIAGLNTEP